MRLVEIGRFGAPFALKGGLKFRGEPVLLHLERVYVEGHGFRAVEDLYRVGEELVVHLAGVTDRTLAEALVGLRVYAEVADLPPLEEGQYYYFALIGLPVYVGGEKVGEVVDILDTGAQDVLVIRGVGERLRHRAERLVPLQAPYVRVEEGAIHVEPIPGLFRLMRYTLLTLFPALVRPWLEESLIARARKRGLLEVEVVDLRAYGLGRHRVVDDTPYGGGAGMVIRADVAVAALEAVGPADEVILLSPAGEPFTQKVAEDLAGKGHLVLLSGRYEGFDARVEAFVTRTLSIGDYVLMGGEVAALAVLEATARLVPGVIGDPQSHREDSFVRGLLDFPHYTRPPEFRGLRVPEVLLSGHHQEVERWRRQEALRRTLAFRPELLSEARIGALEAAWLAELDREG